MELVSGCITTRLTLRQENGRLKSCTWSGPHTHTHTHTHTRTHTHIVLDYFRSHGN